VRNRANASVFRFRFRASQGLNSGVKVVMHYNGPLKAPIAQGQQIGTLTVTAPDYPGYAVPVYAQKEVPEAGIIGKIFLGIRSLISGKK